MKPFGLAAMVLALVACSQPTPSAPAPTALLQVQGTVRESCGSEGGCAYFAELAVDDRIWQAEFAFGLEGGAIVVDEGLPSALSAGDYTLTLTSRLVSDVIVNGKGSLEGVDATCVARFNVPTGTGAVTVHTTFDKGLCSIEVNVS